ncbi:MAG: tRNA guanosine(34) transglycosylase Tgt [Desulfarculaceae bacterium]
MAVPGWGFSVRAGSGRARTALLVTARGQVQTPVFMPVGTAGSIKSLLPQEVSGLGGEIVLANTYHLLLRPGVEVVAELGGLHRFMDWPGPILTDSGGYQVFSLAGFRQVDDEGVSFRSHLDGQLIRLTPESVVEAQKLLGSDIMMMLDECPPAGAGRNYVEQALQRDAQWADRAHKARGENGGAMFGIVQGGVYKDLRARSVELICGLDFEGYALGGLSVGEPKEVMMEVVADTVALLPQDKPIYLMGVGAPADLVACAGLGVDMFDCVMPTRMARNGTMLTARGRLNLRNSRYTRDSRPVEEGCGCLTCRRYCRAYLRHLFLSRELLAYRLGTIHNLYYIIGLMTGIREAIAQDTYQEFARDTLALLEEDDRENAALNHGGCNV